MQIGPTSILQIGAWPALGRGLLSPYTVEVTMDSGAVLEFGRFSIGLLGRLTLSIKGGEGLVFRCGALCETADCKILIGGEHDNGSLWNIALRGQNDVFGNFAEHDGVLPVTPTLLGDNVLISERALIAPGLEIGTGSVIGAGSVVTKDCAPLGVYVGAPAKRLKDRFGDALQALYPKLRLAEVHAHHLPRLGKLVKAVETGEMTLDDYLSEVTFLEKRCVLHCKGRPSGNGAELYEISSASIDGQPVEPAAFGPMVSHLVQDVGKEFRWTPDIFVAMGLC